LKFTLRTAVRFAVAAGLGFLSAMPSAAADFELAARIPAGRSPGTVAIADFDGDRNPDIAVASERDNSLAVLLGDGAGRFVEAPGSPVAAGNSPNDIAVGRINADSDLDIAVANHESDTITVMLGNGGGRFEQASGSPIRVGVKPHPHGIAAADFDGDRDLDLVTDGWETDEVEVLRGDGAGAFSTHAKLRVGRHPYQRVRAWDVDRDGNADIITANLRGASVTVLAGNGRGAFRPSTGSPFPANAFPTAVAIGDFNGDGRPDLAVTNSPSNSAGQGKDGLTVLLAEPDAGFRMIGAAPVETGAAPTQLAVADFDRDGRDDIAVTNMNSGTVAFARVTPDRRTVVTGGMPVGNLPKGVAAGDLNRDGKADLVIANHGDDEIAILLAR